MSLEFQQVKLKTYIILGLSIEITKPPSKKVYQQTQLPAVYQSPPLKKFSREVNSNDTPGSGLSFCSIRKIIHFPN